jgi:hypothetical protein
MPKKIKMYWIKDVWVFELCKRERGKVVIFEDKLSYGMGYHWRRYRENGSLQDGSVEETLLKAMRRGQGEFGNIKGEKWKKVRGKPPL